MKNYNFDVRFYRSWPFVVLCLHWYWLAHTLYNSTSHHLFWIPCTIPNSTCWLHRFKQPKMSNKWGYNVRMPFVSSIKCWRLSIFSIKYSYKNSALHVSQFLNKYKYLFWELNAQYYFLTICPRLFPLVLCQSIGCIDWLIGV